MKCNMASNLVPYEFDDSPFVCGTNFDDSPSCVAMGSMSLHECTIISGYFPVLGLIDI